MTVREVFDKYVEENIRIVFRNDPSGEAMARLRKEWIFNRFMSKKTHDPKDLLESIKEYKRDDERNDALIDSRPDLF